MIGGIIRCDIPGEAGRRAIKGMNAADVDGEISGCARKCIAPALVNGTTSRWCDVNRPISGACASLPHANLTRALIIKCRALFNWCKRPLRAFVYFMSSASRINLQSFPPCFFSTRKKYIISTYTLINKYHSSLGTIITYIISCNFI